MLVFLFFSNHLDMECIDSLAKAINSFNGGVVLVSHDFRLLDQVAKEIWSVEITVAINICLPMLFCLDLNYYNHL